MYTYTQKVLYKMTFLKDISLKRNFLWDTLYFQNLNLSQELIKNH